MNDEDRKRIAPPLLNLLLADAEQRVAIGKIVLELLKADTFNPDEAYDRLYYHDKEHGDLRAEALHKVHDMLFHESGGGTEHDRQQYTMNQLRRRQRERRYGRA